MRNISTPNPGNGEENSQVKSREAMFAVIAALSFVLNFLFCAIMTRKPKMLKRPHNILMFSLAIIDLLTGLSELSFILTFFINFFTLSFLMFGKPIASDVCLFIQHSTLPIGGGSGIIGTLLFIIPLIFFLVIHYSLCKFARYSLFRFKFVE